MSAKQPSGWKKLLGRLALGLGVVAVLVLVPLSIVITNDQLRDAPAPALSFDAFGLEPAPRAKLGATERPAVELAVTTDPTSAPAPLADDRFWRYQPVPDVEALPPDARAEARAWNEQADAFTTRLLALVRDAETMGFDEAWLQLLQLDREAREARKAWDARRDRFPGEWRSYAEWGRNFWLARYLVAARNEKWREAAFACFILDARSRDGGLGGSRHGLWWEREVYCWRQLGARGRVFLARRSAERAIRPVARALDNVGDVFYEKIGRDLERGVIGRLPGHRSWYGPVNP